MVRLIFGAYAYANIWTTRGRKVDIRLEPGRSASQSLREYAAEQRADAQRKLDMAELAEAAADKLDSDKHDR